MAARKAGQYHIALGAINTAAKLASLVHEYFKTVKQGHILHGDGLYGLPTTNQVQQKVYKDLLPHQQTFCQDIGHRKLALVCGFGAGKTYALVDKAIILASMDIGCISAIFEPTSPMSGDILIRTLNELLGR